MAILPVEYYIIFALESLEFFCNTLEVTNRQPQNNFILEVLFGCNANGSQDKELMTEHIVPIHNAYTIIVNSRLSDVILHTLIFQQQVIGVIFRDVAPFALVVHRRERIEGIPITDFYITVTYINT